MMSIRETTKAEIDVKINKQPAMKTIGILGGIGPQATMDLEMRLHKVSQAMIKPMWNSGYPPVVVFYHRHAPFVLKDDLTPVFPLKANAGLLGMAKSLGELSDFMLISSNGAHAILEQIEEVSACPVLSMIDVVMAEVQKRGWRKIGVVGYKNAMVFTNRLIPMNISVETISGPLQEKLDNSVMRLMEGNDTAIDYATAMEVIRELRSKKPDVIIPGCTEIPLLLKEHANAPDLLNPAQLLAEAAIQKAMACVPVKLK